MSHSEDDEAADSGSAAAVELKRMLRERSASLREAWSKLPRKEHEFPALTEKDREALLFGAVKSGNRMRIFQLIDLKVSVNAQDHHGMTPLHYAAALGIRASVRALTTYGACDFLIKDNRGRYAADLALEWGRDRAVSLFLSRKLAQQAHERGVKLDYDRRNRAAPAEEEYVPNDISTESVLRKSMEKTEETNLQRAIRLYPELFNRIARDQGLRVDELTEDFLDRLAAQVEADTLAEFERRGERVATRAEMDALDAAADKYFQQFEDELKPRLP